MQNEFCKVTCNLDILDGDVDLAGKMFENIF